MSTHSPNLLSRLSLALASFFSILSRPGFAADVERLRREGWPAPAPVVAPVAPVPPVAPAAPVAAPPAPIPQPQLAPETAALQLLGLLQREARFIDFVQEDVQAYGDAEIGAAARVVHEGCRKVLREHFTFEPVRAEAEGSRLTLQPGFDADDLGGKAQAKARLQKRMGLQTRADALVFTVVSRLTEQKGLHLLPAVVDELVQRGGQLAVLGAGDAPLIALVIMPSSSAVPLVLVIMAGGIMVALAAAPGAVALARMVTTPPSLNADSTGVHVAHSVVSGAPPAGVWMCG